jgi:hypothetical protein
LTARNFRANVLILTQQNAAMLPIKSKGNENIIKYYEETFSATERLNFEQAIRMGCGDFTHRAIYKDKNNQTQTVFGRNMGRMNTIARKDLAVGPVIIVKR